MLRALLSSAICFAALGLEVAAVAAQRLESRPYPIRRIQSFSIRSAIMGRQYDISIGFPTDYQAHPETKYPALIATDGNHMFPFVWGVVDGLMDQGTIENLLLVTIGTPFELGDSTWVRRRIHEFSPPNWPMTDRFGQLIQGLCRQSRLVPPQPECVGGAPHFLRFIVSELLPALDGQVRIDRDRLGLFGVSAGGFFGAYAMFQAESPFKRYILSSPAMAYGDGEIVRQEARYAESHQDFPVGVYLAFGSLEIDDAYMEGLGQITSGTARLAGLLRTRNYPGLRLHSEVHQGLGHVDTAPVSLARGLRLLFPKTAP
jgi:predicted alpha/beta superfamily hydrolase